nr:unnamed protein product [Callosobruchus chinensis]
MARTYPEIGISHTMLLKGHGMFSLDDRRKMHSLIFLFKIINNKYDCPYFLNQLKCYIPRCNTRNSLTFYLSTPKTNLLLHSPLYSSVAAVIMYRTKLIFSTIICSL